MAINLTEADRLEILTLQDNYIEIFVVMGGFHLTGADFEPIIDPTTQALKALEPEYVIPTHCTGRKATMYLEQEMPDQFLLNMSGTRMVFEGGMV